MNEVHSCPCLLYYDIDFSVSSINYTKVFCWNVAVVFLPSQMPIHHTSKISENMLDFCILKSDSKSIKSIYLKIFGTV